MGREESKYDPRQKVEVGSSSPGHLEEAGPKAFFSLSHGLSSIPTIQAKAWVGN